MVIEPWLTDQWYVNAAELAKAPIEAVKSGAIEIVPKTWEKDLLQLDGEHPAVVCLPPACGGGTGYRLGMGGRELATVTSDQS